MADDASPGNGTGGAKGNGNGGGLSSGIPRDPARFALWAVTGFLALVGLFFATVNGVPWPHKESVTQLQREISRLDKLGDGASANRTALELSLQSMQYELRQLRERADWLEAEIEKVKTYVYPQPSGRAPRPKAPDAPPPMPADALNGPRTKYP
jgi:hypothetical protein